MVRLAKEVSPQAREQELRNFLGQFRFAGDMVHQAVGTLSGGEKARLVLATIVWQRPNLLLLDEPTNHLDLTTREALSMALNEFDGTVMLVSHDRALLREVCDEFWLVTSGGVREFDGDLDDYQKWLLDNAREQARELAQAQRAAAAPPVPREERRSAAQGRQLTAEQLKPMRQELARTEERMAEATAERDALAEQLGRADLPAAERAELGRRLKLRTDEVEALEERWLELSEALAGG
jgi:ATP-binding cassette subfamily F protein 3